MNTNFREELKAAILAEFPQAANPEVTLDEYLDEAEEAHKVHPSIDISTFVVDFATPRGYYNELNPNLDYSKPLNESFITLGDNPSLPKSNPVGRGTDNEKLVMDLIASRDQFKELEYNFGKGVDPLAFKVPETAEDAIMPLSEYQNRKAQILIAEAKERGRKQTIAREIANFKKFELSPIGIQRLYKYTTSMCPKGVIAYHNCGKPHVSNRYGYQETLEVFVKDKKTGVVASYYFGIINGFILVQHSKPRWIKKVIGIKVKEHIRKAKARYQKRDQERFNNCFKLIDLHEGNERITDVKID